MLSLNLMNVTFIVTHSLPSPTSMGIELTEVWVAGCGLSSMDFSAWLLMLLIKSRISDCLSLPTFLVEIVLQNVEVDHLIPIVVVLFKEVDRFIKVLSSSLPRNLHFLRNFFLFFPLILKHGWISDTYHMKSENQVKLANVTNKRCYGKRKWQPRNWDSVGLTQSLLLASTSCR